jgi:hypothetical protein
MERKVLTSIFGSGLLLAMSFSVTMASEAPQAHGNRALATVRMINTAEAWARRTNAKYLSLADLVATGSLQQAAGMNEDLAFTYSQLKLEHGNNLLHGFDFALVVSSEGDAYQFSLSQKESCGSVYFSDQRGIIYAGRALGCPSK